jgi:hypothetical protein
MFDSTYTTLLPNQEIVKIDSRLFREMYAEKCYNFQSQLPWHLEFHTVNR